MKKKSVDLNVCAAKKKINIYDEVNQAVMRINDEIPRVARLIEASPANPSYYMQLAGLYFHMGRHQDEMRCLKQSRTVTHWDTFQPFSLSSRPLAPLDIIRLHIHKQIGSCPFETVQPTGKKGPHGWEFDVVCNWKNLRGPMHDPRQFECGRISINKSGQIHDSAHAVNLFGYVLNSYTGVFEVKQTKSSLICIYPRQYGQLMIALLAKQHGIRPENICDKGNQARRICKIGQYSVIITDYENKYEFRIPPSEKDSLLGLSPELARIFRPLSSAFVVVAFNRPVAVIPEANPCNPEELQLRPDINILIMSEFKQVRDKFSKGQSLRNVSYTFNYCNSTPLPKSSPLTPKDLEKERFPRFERPEDNSGYLAFQSERPEIRLFVESQYRALLDSLYENEVSGTFGGRPFRGRLMKPGTRVYGHSFICDEIRNCLPMLWFDLPFAKTLITTHLKYGLTPIGSINNNAYGLGNPFLQHMPYVWYAYDHSQDKEWLADLYPVLQQTDRFWDKYMFIKPFGLYAGGYGSPDYDFPALGEDERVLSVGLNSNLYIHKQVMARIAVELGDRKAAVYQKQADQIRNQIQQRLWDEEAGFYFAYDMAKNKPYRTPSPDAFTGDDRLYSLHNLISLQSGVPTSEQAGRMMAVFNDPAKYGRFKAIVSRLNASGIDERRLRVWPLYNWFVLQGLRMYGLHAEADRLSVNLFNMVFRSWYCYDNLPECFDATHGYLPEEFPHTGGIGSISLPILLILDRLGFYYSNFSEDMGLKQRSGIKSGFGAVSFAGWHKGKPCRWKYQDD